MKRSIVPVPFTDPTASKIRPALVLHESGDGFVLSFISGCREIIYLLKLIIH